MPDAGGEYIPGEVEQLGMQLDEHTKNHPTAGAAANHGHTGWAADVHDHTGWAADAHDHTGWAADAHDHTGWANENHDHPGSIPIWRAQIDPDVNQPVGAYDVHDTDSVGNLTSASFNDMRDSFRESNLMLIGNNSTDIHFINGGLLMKGFEDHVRKPLRDDVNTNAANITDITKDSSGGLLYTARARITQNEGNIGTNTDNIGTNTGNISTNASNIITTSTNARKTALADLKEVIKEEIDYYDGEHGGSEWVERIGANTAYTKAGALYTLAAGQGGRGPGVRF